MSAAAKKPSRSAVITLGTTFCGCVEFSFATLAAVKVLKWPFSDVETLGMGFGVPFVATFLVCFRISHLHFRPVARILISVIVAIVLGVFALSASLILVAAIFGWGAGL